MSRNTEESKNRKVVILNKHAETIKLSIYTLTLDWDVQDSIKLSMVEGYFGHLHAK